MKRRYYSLRTGKNPQSTEIDLKTLKSLFGSLYHQWDNAGYFQDHFGYWCVDNGDVSGKLGPDIPSVLLFHLRKGNLWPIEEQLASYTEDDFFDVIEFLHDHISKPVEGHFHSYSNCGYHYDTFDANTGKKEYRFKLNELLAIYQNGFEITDTGELFESAQPGTAPLLAADVPTQDPNVSGRVNAGSSPKCAVNSLSAQKTPF